MARDAGKRVDGSRAIRQRHAVDLGGLADAGRFAKLFGNLADSGRGNRGYALLVLGRVGLQMLFIQGESCRALPAVQLERTLELGALHRS